MKNQFDKIFLEFPLMYLNYVGDCPERLNDLIEILVVDKALKTTISFSIDYTKIKIYDFDKENPVHRKIIAAAKMMNVNLVSVERAITYWLDMKTRQLDYEEKYGKDAVCRIGKKLTEDVIEGYFGLREWKVLAAIQSILGKQKPYLRITYEQISYRILGYKRKSIAITESKDLDTLSSQQIKTSVNKLLNKKLLVFVIYNFREKYYSTKIKKIEPLKELILKKKKEMLDYRYAANNACFLARRDKNVKSRISVN